MNRSKIVIFDVDGVIVDSTEECLVIAYNAYLKYSNSSDKSIKSPEEAPEDYSKHFRSIRKYVRSMDEYLCVFNSDPGQIHSQDAYEAALRSLKPEDSKSYGELFFNERETYKKNDMKKWLDLHQIYPGIDTAIKYALDNTNVYIVTGKDKASVIDLLAHLNIEFPEHKIYDKYAAKNKTECLVSISNKEDVAPENIFFIDDNVMHLTLPQEKGFNIRLADWGYGMDEHFQLAREKNIPMVELTAVFKEIEQFL